MSFPQVVEVVVGLVLVYYVLGSIVSTITQIITESLETRGAALELYLKKIAGDRTFDLTNLPQIKSLRPIRYANWWSVFGAGTAEKRVEKIPVSTLVSAYFDLSGLTCKVEPGADEVMAALNALPESEAKHAMLQWASQGVTKLADLQTRATDYFGGILSQAQATFKARARSFVIILSLLVTLILGTDSIQIAKDLWNDAALRAAVAQVANQAVTQPVAGTPGANNLLPTVGTLLPVRVGWWQTESFPAGTTASGMVGFVGLKILGLLITALAVSQGSSFWYDILKRITGQSGQPVAASDGGDGS
jgi:hypothetical protein